MLKLNRITEDKVIDTVLKFDEESFSAYFVHDGLQRIAYGLTAIED